MLSEIIYWQFKQDIKLITVTMYVANCLELSSRLHRTALKAYLFHRV